MNSYAVILAGGSGKRFGAEKQLLKIHGKPVFLYSLEVCLAFEPFSGVVLVVPSGKKKEYEEILKSNFIPSLPEKLKVVEGGAERFLSVKNALQALDHFFPDPQGWVLVHDSARPLVRENHLTLILSALSRFPSVTLGYPVSDALKRADASGMVFGEQDRQGLWAVTTPQGFHREKLKGLLEANQDFLYDETALFSKAGFPVHIVEAGRHNLKITYPEDLEVAARLLQGETRSEKFSAGKA